MENDQNWYRQLAALVLLSASRAAVEYITNPGTRADATEQLKGAFREIDYDAVAKAITRAIDDLADNSKSALSGSIDTLRDKGHDAVDEAKTRAEKQLAQKKRGGKLRFLFALTFGAVLAYFLFDEQRRDDILDRLTGASGPIQQNSYSTFQSSQPSTPAPAPSVASEPTGGASSTDASGVTVETPKVSDTK
jgi:hypothetical protein